MTEIEMILLHDVTSEFPDKPTSLSQIVKGYQSGFSSLSLQPPWIICLMLVGQILYMFQSPHVTHARDLS